MFFLLRCTHARTSVQLLPKSIRNSWARREWDLPTLGEGLASSFRSNFFWGEIHTRTSFSCCHSSEQHQRTVCCLAQSIRVSQPPAQHSIADKGMGASQPTPVAAHEQESLSLLPPSADACARAAAANGLRRAGAAQLGSGGCGELDLTRLCSAGACACVRPAGSRSDNSARTVAACEGGHCESSCGLLLLSGTTQGAFAAARSLYVPQWEHGILYGLCIAYFNCASTRFP